MKKETKQVINILKQSKLSDKMVGECGKRVRNKVNKIISKIRY